MLVRLYRPTPTILGCSGQARAVLVSRLGDIFIDQVTCKGNFVKQFLFKRIRNDPATTAQEKTGRLQIDDEGIIRSADTETERLFGYGMLQMGGVALSDLVASREDNPLMPPLRDTLALGATARITVKHSSGYFFTASVQQAREAAGSEARKRMSISAREGTPLDERILRLVEDSAGLGVWEMDPDSNRMYWSEGMFRLLDLPPSSEVDPEHVLYYFQEHQAQVQQAMKRCLRRGQSFVLELPVLTANQNQRRVRVTGHSLRDGDRVYALAGTALDVSSQQADAEAAHAWKCRTQSVMAASDDLVVIVDETLNIVAINRSFTEQFEKTFGIIPDVGDNIIRLMDDFPEERRLHQRLWERALKQEGFCVEMPLAQSDENLPVFEIQFHRILTPEGDVLGAAHVARSMSAREGVQDNLHYLNSHDPLTGLLNRRELSQRLHRALNIVRDTGTPHALVFLDLDNFTQLNERFGAGGCDRYLRELSGLMMSRLRQRDAIARVAGDQFAIILDNCGEEEALKVCDNLKDAVAGFSYEWQEASMQTTISGGLLPLNSEKDATPEQCLTLAADLCETAKTGGTSRISVYRSPDGISSQAQTREQLAQLQNAIATGAVELHFQALRPIASATWGDHVEVLARLRREPSDTGEVYDALWEPGEFMPLAEQYDLASALDQLVINKTLDWLEAHPLMHPRIKMISFNLSVSSLLDDEFAPTVRQRIENSSFDAESFCFEIRERDALAHPDATARCCRLLHKTGCRIALDSAGTTGATHRLLETLSADIIKIDESLMQGLATSDLQQVMVGAIHRMADLSEAVTVAPFIEDDATLRKVRELGLHFGQGYRLTAPELIEELAPPAYKPGSGLGRTTGS